MKSPSVLFLNRVYPPADGATGQLLAELAPELVKAGWQVTVLTSRPTPDAPLSETVAGVRVERVSGLPFTRASHARRAVSYLSLYPLLLWRALKLPRTDVVVTLTDPPLQLLLGPVLKWTKRSRLVHWAQDVYPELAEELGVLRKGGVLAGLCRGLSTWALRQHDRIIAVGRCMKRRLVARGLAESAIRVVTNWADPARVRPIPHAANPFRREHSLGSRFVVMYSGNFGLAHPFEAILDAARHLRSAYPGILFLFVGDGPRLAWVQQQAREMRLSNVRFLPPQPVEKLAESLSAADVHLATMQENLCGLVVPSKLYGILAAGRPCVFLGPAASEAARTIKHYQCGTVIPAPHGLTLANCLIKWSVQRARWQLAARQAAEAGKEFCVAEAARAFGETLTAACAEERITLADGRAEAGLPARA